MAFFNEGDNDVVIGVDIDIKAAERKLDELREKARQIHLLDTPEAEEQAKAIDAQMDKLIDTIDRYKQKQAATNEVISEGKTATDLASASMRMFGLSGTQAGQYINSLGALITKSSKAFNAYSKSVNDAASSNKALGTSFKSMAGPIGIAVAAIGLAVAAFKKMFAIQKENREKYEELLPKRIEAASLAYRDYATKRIAYLQAIGASEAAIAKESAKHAETQRQRAQAVVDSYEKVAKATKELSNYNLSGITSENMFSIINPRLYSRLDENSKKIVENLIKANEQLKEAQLNEKIIKDYVEPIAEATEEWEESLRNINNENNSLTKKYSQQIEKLERRNSFLEKSSRNSKEIVENEQKIYDLQDANDDNAIDALNKKINANNTLINKYDSLLNKAAKESNIEEKNIILKKKKNLEQDNYNLKLQKSSILNQKSMRLYERMNKVILNNIEYMNRSLALDRDFYVSFANIVNSLPPFDPAKNMSEARSVLASITPIIDEFKTQLTDMYDTLDKLGIKIDRNGKDTGMLFKAYSDALKDFINSEEYSKLSLGDKEMVSAVFGRVTANWSEYNHLINENVNISERLFGDAAESLRRYIDETAELLDVSRDINQLKAGFTDVYRVADKTEETMKRRNRILELTKGDDGKYEALDNTRTAIENIIELAKYVENVDRLLLGNGDKNNFSEEVQATVDNINKLGDEGKAAWMRFSQEIYDLQLESKQRITEAYMGEKDDLLSYYQDFSDVGVASLREYYNASKSFIEMETLLRNDELNTRINELRKYGVSELELTIYKEKEKEKIEREGAARRSQINLDYYNGIVAIASNTAGDLNSIAQSVFEVNDDMSDAQFESHKRIQGATLLASTAANTAQAFGSTYAQAPGGAVAKGIQAGIAAAAVLANGMRAYNELMSMTKNTTSVSAGTEVSIGGTASASSSRVAETLVTSRYNAYSKEGGYQPVLVMNDFEAKQTSNRNLQRISAV